MYQFNLTLPKIRQLAKLMAQREKMDARHVRQRKSLGARQALQVARLTACIEKISGHRKSHPVRMPRAARGALKKRILDVLTAAGASGVPIPDLSAQLKVTRKNLRSWFYNTGKRIEGLRRLKDGRYTYEAK